MCAKDQKEWKCGLLALRLTLPLGIYSVCEAEANSEAPKKSTEQYSLFSCSLFSVLFAANASIKHEMCVVLKLKRHKGTLVRYSQRTLAIESHILVSYWLQNWSDMHQKGIIYIL